MRWFRSLNNALNIFYFIFYDNSHVENILFNIVQGNLTKSRVKEKLYITWKHVLPRHSVSFKFFFCHILM